MIPNTVVSNATFIPDATIEAFRSPAISISSKAMTIPMTVPKKPSEGAMLMKRRIHEVPFSNKDVCTAP